MTYLQRFVLILLLLGCVAAPLQADETERAQLAELVQELDYMVARIDRLAVSQEKAARVHFRYGALREDLTQIRAGMNRYLGVASQAPNTLAPMTGEYVEVVP